MIHMKYQALFFCLKIKKKYLSMLSAIIFNSDLQVNLCFAER